MSEPFTNEPIAVDDLPQLSDEAFVPVDRRYVWGNSSGSVRSRRRDRSDRCGDRVAERSAAVAGRSSGSASSCVLAAVAIAALLEARRLAYQLREHDLSLRSGVIRHRVETIPFSRIQHVSVGRGVIERSLGLATLEVSSAGPDIAVPGLSVADAERIKQTVAERAGVDDDRRRLDDGAPRAAAGAPATLARRRDRPLRSRSVSRRSRSCSSACGRVRSLGVVQFVVAGVFIVRGAADGRLLLVGVVVAALLLAMSVLSWWRYTFQLVDGELVVTSGVLRVDRLTVDVGRIQSIAIEQELLHRMTDLVKVVVDTAGSSQAEFTIDAVARPVAEELQRQATAVSPRRGPMRIPTRAVHGPAERVVFQHTPRPARRRCAHRRSPWAGLALLVPLLALDEVVVEPIADQVSDAGPRCRRRRASAGGCADRRVSLSPCSCRC